MIQIAANNTIGGTIAGADNVISGISTHGIRAEGDTFGRPDRGQRDRDPRRGRCRRPQRHRGLAPEQ
jgi:hypothetical protein